MWKSNAARHRKISLAAKSETGAVKVAIKVFKKTATGCSNPEGNRQWENLCSYLNATKLSLADKYNKLEYLRGCKQQLMPQYSSRKFFTERKDE